jgi:hypothetical protein
MSATLIATTEGEFLLVEAALPGRSPEPIGVLLHERDGGRLELRLRRDWDQWMDEDDEEVFTHLESDFRHGSLRWALRNFSGRVRIVSRTQSGFPSGGR